MTTHYMVGRPPAETPRLYATDGSDDIYGKTVTAHYFLPGTGADWFVCEYDPDEDIIFGWAEIAPGCGEFGYTALKELDMLTARIPVYMNAGGTPSTFIPTHVELDRDWSPQPLRQAIANRR